MVEGVGGNIDGAVDAADAGAGVSVGGDSLELAEVFQVMPSPAVVFVAERGVADAVVVEQEAGYKGYEALNPAFVHASIALLARLGLLGGVTIGQGNINAAGPNSRYLQASLDCLEACGFLEKRGDDGEIFYEFTARGMVLAEDSAPIVIAVDTYTKIMQIVKNILGDSELGEDFDFKSLPNDMRLSEADRLLTSWVVPAVSVLHEMEFQSGALIGENVAEALAEGKLICLTDLTESPEWPFDPSILIFVHVLEEAGLLSQENTYPYYRATPKGQKVFALGGYSELILSYFQMLQKMDRDVGRDAKLNARASSGILEKRVAPYIVKSLRDDSRLNERLYGGATIDFGSGGGEMVQRAVDAGGSLGLKRSYGMDISVGANDEARKELSRSGMGDSAEIVQGNILDEEDLQGLADRISAAEIDLKNVVATINFILHDVGHKAAEDFLRNYAKIFGDAPLIVTETMKMPTSVLRAHPNYQAMSFQFMHTASGQELFTEPEILALFERCGFNILAKEVHSSMPGVNPEVRHDTIITFTIQHKEADTGDRVDELDLSAAA